MMLGSNKKCEIVLKEGENLEKVVKSFVTQQGLKKDGVGILVM